MNASSLIPELIVANFAASRQFYVEVIGFRVKYERQDPPSASLEFEGAELTLQSQQPDSWVLGELSHPFGRGLNLQIRCSDVRALRARIDAAGVSVYRDLHEKTFEAGDCWICQQQFLVADPDGYLLRFCHSVELAP